MLKALIFDLDGVLMNSMPHHADAWIKVIGEIEKRIKINRQDIYDIEGSNHKGVIEKVFNKAKIPINPDYFDKLLYRKREVFLEINESVPFDGMKETLSLLKENYKLGVATGSDRTIAMKMITEFYPDVFDAIVSGEDVIHGKPSPEPYLKAASMLGVYAHECKVIENAPLGVESAINANMYCIAIPTHVEPDLLKKANVIFKNHEELKNYLYSLVKEKNNF